MRKYVNLMSEAAQFRTAARIYLRRWALALAVFVTALIPVATWRWQEARAVRQQHEALEASYKPIRTLTALNTQLRTAAVALVHDERLPLELAQKRPVASLLGIIAAAAAASNGELFIEHLHVAQAPPGAEAAQPPQDRVIIETAATLTYDVANFVEALKVAPIASVKVVADEIVTENGVDRKSYHLECLLSATAPGKAPDAR